MNSLVELSNRNKTAAQGVGVVSTNLAAQDRGPARRPSTTSRSTSACLAAPGPDQPLRPGAHGAPGGGRRAPAGARGRAAAGACSRSSSRPPTAGEGLEAFRARRPELVLTDNVMPALSGIAMTEEIRRLDPKVPVIFITASMDTACWCGPSTWASPPSSPSRWSGTTCARPWPWWWGCWRTTTCSAGHLEQELALLQLREQYHEHQQELAFRKELSILENDYQLPVLRRRPAPGGANGSPRCCTPPHDIMCGDSYSLRRLPDGACWCSWPTPWARAWPPPSPPPSAPTPSTSWWTPWRARSSSRPSSGATPASMAKRLLEDEVLSLTLAWLPGGGRRPGDRGLRHAAPPGRRPAGRCASSMRQPAPLRLPATASAPPPRPGLRPVPPALHRRPERGRDRRTAASTGSTWTPHFAGQRQPGPALGPSAPRWQRPDDDVTFMLLSRVDGPRRLATRPGSSPSRLEAVERGLPGPGGAAWRPARAGPGRPHEFAPPSGRPC